MWFKLSVNVSQEMKEFYSFISVRLVTAVILLRHKQAVKN